MSTQFLYVVKGFEDKTVEKGDSCKLPKSVSMAAYQDTR